VIYNLYMLMLNYLGGGDRVRAILKEKVSADPGHQRSTIAVCGTKTWGVQAQRATA
jgi:hypothetical protein